MNIQSNLIHRKKKEQEILLLKLNQLIYIYIIYCTIFFLINFCDKFRVLAMTPQKHW